MFSLQLGSNLENSVQGHDCNYPYIVVGKGDSNMQLLEAAERVLVASCDSVMQSLYSLIGRDLRTIVLKSLPTTICWQSMCVITQVMSLCS